MGSGLSCSYHMSPHKHWFVTYEKKYSGNILLGNNAPCKPIGIGFVQIRMHDGVVRTLTEVCHLCFGFVGGVDLKGFLVGLKVELCRSEGKESLW